MVSGDLKKQITDALLDIHNKPRWMNKLREYNIERFTPVDMSFYDLEVNLLESVKDLKLSAAYY
jgi:ABC-type phosphate/phosphonate transport system substrate-binding protein